MVRYRIPIGQWPRSAPPLRVAFASDFHAGHATSPALLEAALGLLRDAAPDLLLFGGDFVDLDARHIDALAPLLGALPARLGRFAVLGNHDHMCDAERVRSRLDAAGIPVLANRCVELSAGGPLTLCGLGDFHFGDPDPAVLDRGGPVRLVLMHQPSNLRGVGRRPFRLALCGHTHGGQIALPGGIPLVLPAGPLSRRFSRGRYELGDDRTLVVSRGVGCTRIPVRLFAPPEITMCDLTPSEG